MSNSKSPVLLLDPSSKHYYEDRLFDITDTHLNRDGTLVPFHRLSQHAQKLDYQIHTADWPQASAVDSAEYYSLGIIDGHKRFANASNVKFSAALIMEPPVVAPRLYAALPRLTAQFERVYVHNTHGMGYSTKGVDTTKLRKLYWPMPYQDVQEPYWSSENRENRIVVINGNHNPRFRAGEQYSTRIEAMARLAPYGVIDLYGFGWDKWWTTKSMWLPYWWHRSSLMSIYKGSCPSKFEVLSRYRFCLCFENMAMDGYITEKLFDCLYAGTIPLYLGAPDIEKFVPENVYVDCRKFSSWEAMWEEVKAMPANKIEEMRQAGREFLASEAGMRFYNSMDDILEINK